jgi:hypothetical protein
MLEDQNLAPIVVRSRRASFELCEICSCVGDVENEHCTEFEGFWYVKEHMLSHHGVVRG